MPALKTMNKPQEPEAAETVQTASVPAGDLPRLIRPLPTVGDYVLATKYGDGDPQDHWCIGFYAGLTNSAKYDPPRYDVVDGNGRNFRGNGFRRVEVINRKRGEWMLKHARDIELSGISVWHFAICPMDSETNTGLEPEPMEKNSMTAHFCLEKVENEPN